MSLYANDKLLIEEDGISILIQLYTLVEELVSLIQNEWVGQRSTMALSVKKKLEIGLIRSLNREKNNHSNDWTSKTLWAL